jgi:hypothetical protein
LNHFSHTAQIIGHAIACSVSIEVQKAIPFAILPRLWELAQVEITQDNFGVEVASCGDETSRRLELIARGNVRWLRVQQKLNSIETFLHIQFRCRWIVIDGLIVSAVY